MKAPKANLNSEILQLRTNSTATVALNFHRIIAKQQEVIASLNQEILMLKSYIALHNSTTNEPFCIENSTISTSSSNQTTLNKELEDSLSHGYKNHYEKIIKEIVAILNLKEGTDLDDPQLIDSIKQLKETAVKKQEPIFVERIKEIKVPITVQKIIQKPVEKIVEKIVYVERQKEKAGDRWRQYENEEHEMTLSKAYSDRNLNKTMAPYREEKYQEKYQQKGRYDQYKRNQAGTGNPLIKKRSEASKNFGYRKDY